MGRRRGSSRGLHLIALAALAAVAGCGGSGSSSASHALTHEQLVSKADAICGAAAAHAKALPQPTSRERIIAFVDQATPVLDTLQRRLSALKPPAKDKAAYDRLLRDQATGLNALPKLKAAAETGNAVEARQAAAALAASPADRDARALGLTTCAAHVSPQG